ncbi:16S rRNA (uracil(1498)-N(3))-methyltransferase [Anaerotignum sp.]|uniref:16S rRNA (uracil(1498)-N(3))-methyltransferase n=1 Tax=Anaerotignum sp. TaxID=2039241 RepID=UPI0027147C2F|nr:16S rRNA (uracil(1498)-N(3))-methyltransferase [Anaerotignum sp.]
MPKFFVEAYQIQNNLIHMTGEDAKHIKTVLRSREGEEITVCDGMGTDYFCRISALDEGVTAEIIRSQPCQSEPKTRITLYQGLPKADKMELIIQKCVELGVDRIVAVSTERCIVKLDKKEEKKLERWQKIAESAAKQSGRGKIPQIAPKVLRFSQAVEEVKTLSGAIIPYEKEENRGIRSFVEGFVGEEIGVFIGPEGGFTEEEIQAAMDAGVLPVTLGKRILRTETAGMAAIAILLYELG